MNFCKCLFHCDTGAAAGNCSLSCHSLQEFFTPYRSLQNLDVVSAHLSVPKLHTDLHHLYIHLSGTQLKNLKAQLSTNKQMETSCKNQKMRLTDRSGLQVDRQTNFSCLFACPQEEERGVTQASFRSYALPYCRRPSWLQLILSELQQIKCFLKVRGTLNFSFCSVCSMRVFTC